MPNKNKLWRQYSLSQYKILQKKWFWLMLIVLSGFLLRLVAYGFIKLPWIIFDEFIYLDTARQIVRGGVITQLTRDPQAYPLGWPLVFSTFSGWISNPQLQYYLILLFTMLISSLVPVLVYSLFRNLWVSLLLAVYPPLFVYSSSIMSETFYTFFLFGLVLVLQHILKDDLRKRVTLWLAAFIFAFFLYYARLIRSFALVYFYSFITSMATALYFINKKKSRQTFLRILIFTGLTVLFYFLIRFIGNRFLLPETGFYNKSKYIKALLGALTQPRLSFVILKNQIVMSLFSLFWFLPIFFVLTTVKQLKNKEWHLVIPRLWLISVYIFSFFLTLAHMYLGTQNNPQYLIFSRYLDPVITILFAYSANDFFDYLKGRDLKLKLPWLIYAFYAYFLWYFITRFYYGSYKFGNTMSVYYLRNFFDNPLAYALLVGLLGAWLYTLVKGKLQYILPIFITLFIWLSFSAIKNTIVVPKNVTNKYAAQVADWRLAMSRYDHTDLPICVHIGGISAETYYLYHFLYPYQYLKNCTSYGEKPTDSAARRPKRIITLKSKEINLPSTCVLDFKFQSGETIYYCPLGY